jgi:hypothetical protein
LSTYGIPRDAFPFTGSNYELDLTHHQFWLQQCQQNEQLKHASSSATTNKETNNKHIKFLTRLWQGDTPTENDVLCVGRRVNGKGNERFIALAALHSETYDNGSQKERRGLVNSIMQDIRATGGRFLKLDTTSSSEEQGKGWVQVPEKEMRQKICQTFRNLRYRRRGPLQLNVGDGSAPFGESSASNSASAIGKTSPPSTPTMIVDSFTPHDVLFGKMKNHLGNQRLRDLVQNSAVEYDAGHRGEKLQLVRGLIARVQGNGGRFLKQSEDGRWEGVSDEDAAKKVGAHFRNHRRKNWR